MLLLLKYAPAIAAALALAAVIFYVQNLRSTIQEQAALIIALQVSVQTQNAAIERMVQDTKDRAIKNAAALAQARKAAVESNKRATTLLQRPQPQGTTACEAADTLLNEALK